MIEEWRSNNKLHLKYVNHEPDEQVHLVLPPAHRQAIHESYSSELVGSVKLWIWSYSKKCSLSFIDIFESNYATFQNSSSSSFWDRHLGLLSMKPFS